MQVALELSNGGRIVLWRVMDKPVISVGSNPECDLCVPGEGVSTIQFILSRDGERVVLSNRHPTGTRVGDETVEDDFQVADGDVITFGPVNATVRFTKTRRAVGATRTLTPHSAPSRSYSVTAPERFGEQSWAVTETGVTVGSDANNDIIVDNDDFVSGFHLRLAVENGRCMAHDLDSRNGVFVGEQKVREAEVPPGSQVRVGQTVLMVSAGADGEELTAPLSGTRLVGRSEVMDHLRELVRRLAQNDAPVLVTGETGTGKEVVARLMHELSPRAGRGFVAINCGTLGKSLIESELFGHEKGAFTGAVGQKKGAFEAADGGTLFLDELGELPLDLQPQLLRAVESGEIRRVGSTESFQVNVRLVTATNRRLEDEVAAGNFREDLFHRLHVLVVELPPLRERKADIPQLVDHFVDSLSPKGSKRPPITDAAMRALAGHDWPGNVRELRNVLQRAILMRAGDAVDADDVTFIASSLVTRVQAQSAVSGRTLAEIERNAIEQELIRQAGNKREAAVALGVSRSTVHRKLDEYGIDVEALLGRKAT